MTDNPKSYEVILFDHCEPKNDESGQYLSVFNLDGTNYKINAKRQAVWKPFEKSQKGTPILLTFETFTNERKERISFITDAQVADFDAVWRAGIQSTLKRLLLAKDDDRIRSQALSYAKDVWVSMIANRASTIKQAVKKGYEIEYSNDWNIENTLDLARAFFYFIKGQQDIEVPHIEEPEKQITEEEASR